MLSGLESLRWGGGWVGGGLCFAARHYRYATGRRAVLASTGRIGRPNLTTKPATQHLLIDSVIHTCTAGLWSRSCPRTVEMLMI